MTRPARARDASIRVVRRSREIIGGASVDQSGHNYHVTGMKRKHRDGTEHRTMWDAKRFFSVRPSSIANANDGLWSNTAVPRGTLIRVEHTRARNHENPGRSNVIVLEYGCDSQVDPDSPCLLDGRLTEARFLPERSRNAPARFVYADRSQEIMKANDLAYSPRVSCQQDYAESIHLNHMELIMRYERGALVCACALVTRDIAPGEEVGITYGYGYWGD